MIGTDTGEQYETSMEHSMALAGIKLPTDENNSPTGSATSPNGTVEAFDRKNPGPILPAPPPPFSSPPLQPGPTWNQLPPGARPGERLSMEEKRKSPSDLPSMGAGRGEGGAGGNPRPFPSQKEQQLEQVPWTSKDGNPWGMSDKDYLIWRKQPQNKIDAEEWERNNPNWQLDMTLRNKLGVKEDKEGPAEKNFYEFLGGLVNHFKIDPKAWDDFIESRKPSENIEDVRDQPMGFFEQKYNKIMNAISPPKRTVNENVPVVNRYKGSPEDKAGLGDIHVDKNWDLMDELAQWSEKSKKEREEFQFRENELNKEHDTRKVIPGKRSQTDEQPDEIKAGQQYAMEERRKPLSELPSGAGRGEGGAGGISKERALKLERDLTSSELPGEHFKMTSNGKYVGGISLTPEKYGNKQVLHVDFVQANKPGATPTERAQAALEFRKALQEQYPDAVGVYGHRVSGIKRGKDDPYQFVPLKDEFNGKDIKALIEKVRPWRFYRATDAPQ